MEICDHLIQTDSIIGIGPLYQKEHPDMTMRNLYRPVRLEFEVHTKYGPVAIHSDYYNVGSIDTEEKKKAQERYIKFENKYFASRKTIAELTGESVEEQNRHEKKNNDQTTP